MTTSKTLMATYKSFTPSRSTFPSKKRVIWICSLTYHKKGKKKQWTHPFLMLSRNCLQPLLVEFWGLPPLILFFNTSTGWFGRFVLSTIINQNKEAWLHESKLAKMLCTGCREFGINRWKFLPKVKHFIF